MDTQIAESIFKRLVENHSGIDCRSVYSYLDDVIIQAPDTGERFYDPYIPFVGPYYKPGGVMIIATAQNLAQFGRSGDVKVWLESTGLPDRSLFRLYWSEGRILDRLLMRNEVRHKSIAIQPFEDGILPALAGLWLAASGGPYLQDLDEITARIAVTNFFKQSLRTKKGADLNPKKLKASKLRRYSLDTLQYLAGPEVELLKPGVILAFRTVPQQLCNYAPAGSKFVVINDPSWVKRGMSGAAKPETGSWYRQVHDASYPKDVKNLVRAYLDQMSKTYKKDKREAARIYLLKYFLKFQAEVQRPV